jgi:uncharacterized protein YbaA (DUF1428 family)
MTKPLRTTDEAASFRQGPSCEVDDAAAEKMQSDKRIQPPAGGDMLFDATRVIYGDFTPVVE